MRWPSSANMPPDKPKVLNRLCPFILTGMLLGVAVSRATDRYVAPTGSNENPGTLASPWKTIRYGANRLDPGDTLYVRAGIYPEVVVANKSGTIESPITITNYPKEQPVIDGRTIPDTDWQTLVNLNGNYIHLSGFEVMNCNMQSNQPAPAFPSGGYGVNMAGHDNHVSRMNVHHNRSVGILGGGDGSIVEDCRVWQNCQDNNTTPHKLWGSGLTLSRGGNNGTGITHNAIARRNIVFNNWGEGLNTFEADGALVEDNIVYDNFSVNLYISDARNVLAQRNLVYVSSNSLIPGATSITLADEVAGKPRSANNKVINNFIYGGRVEAFFWSLVKGSGLDNVLIANNTFVNAQLKIGTYTPDLVNKNSFVRNNIFVSDNGNPPAFANNTAGITFSNNAWSGAPPPGVSGKEDVTSKVLVSKTGDTSAGHLTADYFRTLPGSSSIDHGMTLPGVTDSDFFNHPRSGAVDIGAHEITSIPSPWATQDVGAVGVTGIATYAADAFTVSGAGNDIRGEADEFRYLFQTSSGDCSISARLAPRQNTSRPSKAGLMIRENNSPGSRYAAVLLTPGNGITFRCRPVANGPCYQASDVTSVTTPCHLKLARVGHAFGAFYSADGKTWSQIGGTLNLNISPSARIGMAVTSQVNDALATATFDHVVTVP